MPSRSIGQALIAAGVVLVAAGILTWAGALSWLGRLPGDIRVQRPGVSVYVPITTMLIVSIVLSLIAAVVSRLFR